MHDLFLLNAPSATDIEQVVEPIHTAVIYLEEAGEWGIEAGLKYLGAMAAIVAAMQLFKA